jgi:hypothetical protein
MICVLKSQTSQIMAKAVDDGINHGSSFFDGEMDDGTPHLV